MIKKNRLVKSEIDLEIEKYEKLKREREVIKFKIARIEAICDYITATSSYGLSASDIMVSIRTSVDLKREILDAFKRELSRQQHLLEKTC